MSLFRKNQGRLGEDAAVEYLQKQQYKILERNFTIRGGEIDIIAIDQREQVLAFIEVKTRKSSAYGTPLEAITPWKLRPVIKAAQFYKISHPHLPDAMRIDAVAVTLDEKNAISTIDLVKNIT